MNCDSILGTPRNICAHLNFSKMCLILIWGLNLVGRIVFVCFNVLWCTLAVYLQWEAVGMEHTLSVFTLKQPQSGCTLAVGACPSTGLVSHTPAALCN